MEHRKDTIPICNSLIEQGWWAQPVFYSDTAADLLLAYAAEGVDGYISRVNPDVYEDLTVSKYDKLLETLHETYGLAAMAHPKLIQVCVSRALSLSVCVCVCVCVASLALSARREGGGEEAVPRRTLPHDLVSPGRNSGPKTRWPRSRRCGPGWRIRWPTTT